MSRSPLPRFATIDIGTNSVLLLVAERRAEGGFDPVVEQAEITRLGRGVDATQTLSAQGMADTLEVLERYAATARGLGVERIAVTATSAARDAKNGAEFIAEAKRRAGLTLEIISGDAEARLSFLAVEERYGDAAHPLVVIDIGGGSTELIYGAMAGAETSACRSGLPTATVSSGSRGQETAPTGPVHTESVHTESVHEGAVQTGSVHTGSVHTGSVQAPGIAFRRSFDVGAVRLTERFVHGDVVTAAEQRAVLEHLARTFSEAPAPDPNSRVVGVAGTVTTLFAVQNQVASYDAALVEGRALALDEVRSLRERLCAMPIAERRTLPGLQPKRADVICAGAMILESALERLGAKKVIVSDRGVRWGLLVDRFGGAR